MSRVVDEKKAWVTGGQRHSQYGSSRRLVIVRPLHAYSIAGIRRSWTLIRDDRHSCCNAAVGGTQHLLTIAQR